MNAGFTVLFKDDPSDPEIFADALNVIRLVDFDATNDEALELVAPIGGWCPQSRKIWRNPDARRNSAQHKRRQHHLPYRVRVKNGFLAYGMYEHEGDANDTFRYAPEADFEAKWRLVPACTRARAHEG